jgi:uncharacterized protein
MQPTLQTLRGLTSALGAAAIATTIWACAGQPLHAEAGAFVLLAACGLLSGFLSGLLGIGGALVVVPALYLLLPVLGVAAEQVPHVAVGTSLTAMIPTAFAALVAHGRRGTLDVPWLRRLGPAVALGALLGALAAGQLRGSVLSLLFASQSLYYGWGLLRGAPPARSWRARLAGVWGHLPPPIAGPLAAAFCCCAGMGAGSMTVPYLLQRGVPLLRAAATSTGLNLAIAVAGALTFLWPHLGEPAAAAVCWPAAALVGGCALCSVRHGVACALRLPVQRFRQLLGGVTLAGAAVLVARTLLA